MDFKNLGWSELFTFIGMALLAALIWTGHLDGAIGAGMISAMVATLTTMRKINNGQQIKVQAGSTTVETQGGTITTTTPPAA
jgi:hypothetical protein